MASDSEAHAGRTLWDSHKSPFLFSPDALEHIRAPKAAEDMLVRYVSLEDSVGISVAFGAGDLLSVISHTTPCQDQPAYTQMGPFAVWTYVPISKKDRIVNIWVTYPRNGRLKMCALIVRASF